jgi:hypothetical protein
MEAGMLGTDREGLYHGAPKAGGARRLAAAR